MLITSLEKERAVFRGREKTVARATEEPLCFSQMKAGDNCPTEAHSTQATIHGRRASSHLAPAESAPAGVC